MANANDLCRFLVGCSAFDVGEAVYAGEQVVAVRAYWDSDGEELSLVFESDPDAMEPSKDVRDSQSWCLWVKEDMLRKILSLAEFIEKPSGD